MDISGRLIWSGAVALALSGCAAGTSADVATVPAKAGSRAVAAAAASQSEANRTHSRKLRKREERLGELQRKYRGQLADCQHGDHYACSDARVTYGEIEELKQLVPPASRAGQGS